MVQGLEIGGYIASRISVLSVIILTLLLAFTLQVSAQSDDLEVSGYIKILIEEHGSPSVYLYINHTSGPTAILLELPIEPLAGDIEVVSGNVSLAIYAGDLYAVVVTNSSGGVILKYSAIYSAQNGIYGIHISKPSWASYIELIVGIGVKLDGLPPSVSPIYNGSHVIYSMENPYQGGLDIYYSYEETREYGSIGAIFGVSIAAVAITSYTMLRRRSRGYDRLDSVDLEILRTLKKLGGEAPTTILHSETSIARTTLWRRLRKLSMLGYVDMVKVGRAYLVRLRRKRNIDI